MSFDSDFQEFRHLDNHIIWCVDKQKESSYLEDIVFWGDKVTSYNRRYIELYYRIFEEYGGKHRYTEEQRNILRNRLNFYKILDPEGS